MDLKLHDTLSGTVRALDQVEPGKVSIYLCGPTVQAPPHLGHARSAVIFDVLRRWLTFEGQSVVFCRNVTDVDDKIIAVARETGHPWWKVSTDNKRRFDVALVALGVAPPDVEPLASAHIPEMLEMIDQLLDAEKAYIANGSVYFRVARFDSYGALSHRSIEQARQSEDDGRPDDKESAHDFALWKAAKPGEPSWYCPTTRGRGRPGWHIECSAMAKKYLGDQFDLHGGGYDLVFPHHENERAQSLACEFDFARHWMHNGLISMSGEKMSKSLGNVVSIEDAIAMSSSMAVRYYLLTGHYRSELSFSESSLTAARKAWDRLRRSLQHAAVAPAADLDPQQSDWVQFKQALDDDLNTALALGVMHTAASTLENRPEDGALAASLVKMAEVLGLSPIEQGSTTTPRDSDLVQRLLELREQARLERDFALADTLRRVLVDAGVEVHDDRAVGR